MACRLSPIPQLSGKLVAFEGESDSISTQLQLLPPSQKILVLPSLVDRLPRDTRADLFNVRAFIRAVHTAFIERTEAARAFLQSSTPAHPRLVFMNGGSVRARAICISKICENLTGGDFKEAESLFNEMVRDGVTGLMKQEIFDSERPVNNDQNGQEDEEARGAEVVEEDPISRAMKAADSLDRETAVLQAENEELEAHPVALEDRDEIRSNISQEELDVDGSPVEAPSERDDIKRCRQEDEIVRTVLTIPSRTRIRTWAIDAKNDNVDAGSQATPFLPPSHYSLAGLHQRADITEHDDEVEGDKEVDKDEDEQSDHSLESLDEQPSVSMPHTPRVIYGEACIVDVQSPMKTTSDRWFRKVKSLDRIYGRNVIGQVESMRSVFEASPRPRTSGGRVETEYARQGFSQLPRTTFVRAAQTTIKPHTPSASVRSITSSKSAVHVYVDKGTDAGGREELVGTETEEESPKQRIEGAFEPVFPLVEDLIIHFTSNTVNEIFDATLESYRNGAYPITPSLLSDVQNPPSPSTSSTSFQNRQRRPQSQSKAGTDDNSPQTSNEYDPYSFHNGYHQNTEPWPGQKDCSMPNSAIPEFQPPTPSITPPPTKAGPRSDRFCDFSPVNQKSVIDVQNSLRALLSIHFPAGENGYSQHYFPASPEPDRLWKPVWKNHEHAGAGIGGRNFDLMVALGCEDGVKNDFFALISGQVERLGVKADGRNRSGKLDIRYILVLIYHMNTANWSRYLISVAVQNLTDVSVDNQSGINPSSNPLILATLLVPQLEAYLATNPDVRFLVLTYPANHLSTIIALRRLIGQDVLKVAGILDSLSSDPPSFASRPRTPTSFHALSTGAVTTSPRRTTSHHSHAKSNSFRTVHNHTPSHRSRTSESTVSFSKADYLLPSMATDAERTSFLSSIRTSLIEKSPFYHPEPEPAPVIIEKIIERFIERPSAVPPPTSTSSYPPVSYRAPRELARDSKIARLTGGDADAPSGARKKGQHYAASIASTIRTTASERFGRERRYDEETQAWEDFYVGEIDSDDDAFDRMIMGRSGARIIPDVMRQLNGKKRSSKKALKWLGLA